MGENSVKELEASIERHLRIYSAKRIALAASLVGVSAVAAALGTFLWTGSTIFSALALGVTSLILVNVALIAIVPPEACLNESKKLLAGAVRNPKRIKKAEKEMVTLLTAAGDERNLNKLERELWHSVVVPAFMKNGLATMEGGARPARKLTASERRYVEEQKKLIVEKEKTIAEEQKRIAEEKARILEDQKELEGRSKELQKAEDMVIERLSSIETLEAELEQLREDIDHKRSVVEGGGLTSQALSGREAALKEKEAELELLKEHLTRDREAVEAQKTDLNQLKGELLRAGSLDESDFAPSVGDRSGDLEARLERLEAENRRLLERSRYVEDVENSLIDRLNQLSEREASIEQREINRGIRKD